MSRIDPKEVREIARLARLRLSDDEVARMARELDAILTHIEELRQLDTEAVEPMTHAVPFDCPLREDVVGPDAGGGRGAGERAPPRRQLLRGPAGGAGRPAGRGPPPTAERTDRERARRGGRDDRRPGRAASATGRLRARDLCEAYLARIGRVDPQLGSYLLVDAEGARAQADAVDARVARGEDPGPLAGVPIALKDLYVTRGLATTCGSRILRGFVPPYESTAGARLAAAGAVRLGKLNMDEFAMGSSNLGVASGAAYGQRTEHLSPGDLLVLHTDGLAPRSAQLSPQPDGEEPRSGAERLLGLAPRFASAWSARECVRAVAQEFGDREREDDACVLVARVTP